MSIQQIRRFIRMHKSLVTYGVVLGVAVIGLFAGVVPAFKKDMVLFGTIQNEQKEVEVLEKKSSLLSSYPKEDLETIYAIALSALPSEKSVSTFMEAVETLAAKHNVLITNEEFERIGPVSGVSDKTKSGDIEKLGMVLNVRGELANLRAFFEDMIHVRRLMVIKDMDISFSTKSYQPEATIHLETYYAPLPSTIGSTSAPLPELTDPQVLLLETLAQYPIAYPVINQQAPVSAAAGEPQQPASENPFNPNPE